MTLGWKLIKDSKSDKFHYFVGKTSLCGLRRKSKRYKVLSSHNVIKCRKCENIKNTGIL